MTAIRPAPKFDHGAALRVPAPQDAKARRVLWQWLGEEGCALDDRGAVQVSTPFGPVIARPGDWIVLSHNGQYHVARASTAWDA
ncbi:MAG TPA: hypothetical protein VGM25_01835 [Caulobacteraceae bacterium]|jgi:hypothetical protein